MELECYCGKKLKNISIKNHDYNIYEISCKCICGQQYESTDRGYCEDLDEAKRILSTEFNLKVKLR